MKKIWNNITKRRKGKNNKRKKQYFVIMISRGGWQAVSSLTSSLWPRDKYSPDAESSDYRYTSPTPPLPAPRAHPSTLNHELHTIRYIEIAGPVLAVVCTDMYLRFPYHFVITDNIVKAFCRKQWVITSCIGSIVVCLDLKCLCRVSSSVAYKCIVIIYLSRSRSPSLYLCFGILARSDHALIYLYDS
jgi:hypothetical protein